MNFNNTEKLVLVDFYADWCGPCQVLKPILKQVEENLGDKVVVEKVDIDLNPDLGSQYEVISIPTLILFKNGEIVWKQKGVLPFSEIKKNIEKYS